MPISSLAISPFVEGDLYQAIEYSRKAQRIAMKTSQDVTNLILNEVRQHNELGDVEGAKEGLATVRSQATANPQLLRSLGWKILLNESRMKAVEGHWDEAIRLMRSARASGNTEMGKAEADVFGARLLALVGKKDEALTLAYQARAYFNGKSQLDSQVKCECAVAEVLWLSSRALEAAQVARDALALGDGKANRLGLWHCALVLAAASPRDRQALNSSREQFQKLTTKWPAQGKNWLLARQDLQHLLWAVPAVNERNQ